MTEPDGTRDGAADDAEPQVAAADAASTANGDTSDAATAGAAPDAADPPGAGAFIDEATKHSDPPGAAMMMDSVEFSAPSGDFVVPTSAEPDNPGPDPGPDPGSTDEGDVDTDA